MQEKIDVSPELEQEAQIKESKELNPDTALGEIKENSLAQEKDLEEIKKEEASVEAGTLSRGVLGRMEGAIKESKLLKAGVLAFSLMGSAPALADEIVKSDKIKEGLNNLAKIEQAVEELPANLSELLGSETTMSDQHKEQLASQYKSLSGEKRKIVEEALAGRVLSDKDKLNYKNNSNWNMLKMQQIINDKTDAEYPIDLISADKEQIAQWVEYIKDPKAAEEREKDWEEKNKKGWQNIYPDKDGSRAQEGLDSFKKNREDRIKRDKGK